jgi:hypothetical protein
MPTRGDLLSQMPPGPFFAICIAVTGICFAGTVTFAVYLPIPSMAFGFTILTVILGGCSVYAGWYWRTNARKTGSLK